MVRRIVPLLLTIAVLVSVPTTNAHAQSALTRHVREVTRTGEAKLIGQLPPNQTMSLDVVLPLRDRAGLQSFLGEVYDPASPFYRQFITPQEFTARFGPTQADYDAVVSFAKAHGLAVVGGSRDAMDVQIRGPVSSVEAAFHLTLHTYQHPTEDRTFYAPDSEPTTDLPFPLWHVSGLDNYSIPHPMVESKTAYAKAHDVDPRDVVPNATTGSGPDASFLGSDMRAAYYGETALTGAGQNLGLLEYVGTDLADLDTYYTNAGQTLTVPITLLSTDGTSTSCIYAEGCDDLEQTIDMTQALGMAPGLASLTVYVGSSDTAIIGAMTTNNPLPATIGCSWTWSPVDPSTLDPYFEKMAAQGQNFFAASGDHSTWSFSNDDWPSDDPNVVSVGGTDLVTSGAAGPWASETAWSDSGGGISPNGIPIPAWQQISGVINSSNKGSTTLRNGPDVSANANFTFYVCANQSGCTANEWGGTSFAAPMWAGYVALVNQQLASNSEPTIGFINPTIYEQNVTSQYSTDFHDITSGCSGSYCAVTGYDLVTGWGSPNGAGLITALSSQNPSFAISAVPASVTVAAGTTSNSIVTASVLNGFDAPISFAAAGQPTGVTVTFSPSSIAAPGSGSTTMTVTVPLGTSSSSKDSITITAAGGGYTQSIKIPLSVEKSTSANFAISSSPTSVSVAQGSSGASTVTTTIDYGFNYAVSLSASGLPAGVTVSFSPASIAAPGSGSSVATFAVASTVAAGTYAISLTGTGNGIAHSTAVSLTVTTAGNFTVSALPTSVSVVQGSSGTSTVTTTVSNGFNYAVSLSASGQPAGVTVTFNPTSIAAPGAGTSVATFAVAATAVPGTYTVTLSGTGNGITQSANVSLTVTPLGTFSISASPTTVSVVQGNSGTSTVTTTGSGGFNSAINLSASGQPAGVTVSFNPTSIAAPGSGTSTATFAVSSTAAPGTYTITLTGTGDGVTESTTVSLTVTAAPSFTISASPTSVSVVQGNSGASTVTTTAINGFNNEITLSATGQPSGVTVTFNPTSIAAPGSGTSTATFAVSSTAAPGTYTITLTGTGGGVTESANVSLTVTSATNGFTISVSPNSGSVDWGQTIYATVTTTATGTFDSPIVLSATGQPTGVTVTFTPTSIAAPGTGTSQIAITVPSTGAADGHRTITITGKGGGITQSTSFTVDILR
jgi:subtilase family serine protease